MGLDSLKKWSGRHSGNYRPKFERELPNCVNAYPVHIRVVSAQGGTIKDFFPTILTHLGIADLVRPIVSGTKRHLEFGPFVRVTPEGVDKSWACKLPERQAIPLLFICYFLARAHRDLMPLIQRERPHVSWADWQIMHNKFPGDVHGPMGELFGAIMTSAARASFVAGNVRLGTFNDARSDPGNLLADNIAGLFSDKLQRGDRTVFSPVPRNQGASLMWEIWDREPIASVAA